MFWYMDVTEEQNILLFTLITHSIIFILDPKLLRSVRICVMCDRTAVSEFDCSFFAFVFLYFRFFLNHTFIFHKFWLLFRSESIWPMRLRYGCTATRITWLSEHTSWLFTEWLLFLLEPPGSPQDKNLCWSSQYIRCRHLRDWWDLKWNRKWISTDHPSELRLNLSLVSVRTEEHCFTETFRNLSWWETTMTSQFHLSIV